MKILISTNFTANTTESMVKPLILLPEVKLVYYVSDCAGPLLDKVKYYYTPFKILKLFNNNAIIRALWKFFIVFYIALFKRPDFLMGYNFTPHGIIVGLIGKIFNIPACVNMIGGTVGIQGNSFSPEKGPFIKKIRSKLNKIFLKVAKHYRLIIVTGSSTRDYLISHHGIDNSKIKIMSGAVNTKKFFPFNGEKRYDLIIVAQLMPTKRIDIFLDVVSQLVKDNFSIKALVLGDGMLREYLENLSSQIGLKDIVEFRGFCNDVEKYLNKSKIFLFPSVKEGLSLAMLEAMACGVVPIVLDVDDLSDAVKNNINGKLIHRDDINGFVSAAAELLKDTKRYRLYSENAVKFICDNYTINNASIRWREILRPFIARKKTYSWYFKRLKAMNPFEILYRLKCIVKSKFLYLRFLLARENDRHIIREVFHKGIFFIDKKDLGFIKEKLIKENINQKLEGLEDIDWQNGLGHIDDIERRAGFYSVELNEIWRLNRFQWLVEYAQRYSISRDEQIVEKIIYVLKDWIYKNPVMKGINWLDASEAALRLLSWLWIYFLVGGFKKYDKDFERIFLKSIYFQACFIESNLSKYSSANNHLISQAAGLFITGLFFPQLRNADNWVKKGKVILEKEIRKQIYPDGVSKEQSTHYHEFVTDLYLLAVIIGKRNKIVFSSELYSRLCKMCEFLIHMMDKNGILPNIGDSDDNVAIKLDICQHTANVVSILNTASIFFNNKNFKMSKEGIDEKSLWLLGYSGYVEYSQLEKEDDKIDSKGFLNSGYYIIRHNGLFVSFDCGKLGYLSLASHGHADSLSFVLNVENEPIFIDPGTYLYHSGGEWRDYFRSTSAHNTVRIDKIDQSDIQGPFLWGYKAKSYLKCWSPNGGVDKVCGYHTGYTRLKDPVLHERGLTLNKLNREMIIKDSIFAKKEHFLEQFFHLHPNCELVQIKQNVFKISKGETVLFIELDKGLAVSLLNGSEEPIGGWYSEEFGRKIKSFTIHAENYFKGNVDLITKIWVVLKRPQHEPIR